MGTWALHTAFLLFCLTPDSLQGGLPKLSSGLGQGFGSPKDYRAGYGSPSGLGAGFGNRNGLEAQPGLLAQDGYGGDAKAGMKPQRPGLGGGPKPQKPALSTQNGHGPGIGAGTKPQKPGLSNGNGLGAQPGFGGGRKPQKPGLGNGNRMGARALPRAGTLPGLGGGLPPQKPGPASQNGYGPGYGGNVKPQKPGFGGGVKPQKPGYNHGNGRDAWSGLGVGMNPQRPAPTAQNGYGPGHGGDMKTQKPGYRNGLGAGAFTGTGALTGLGLGTKPPKPGYANGIGLAAQPGPCNGGVIPWLLPRPPTPAIPSDRVGGWGLRSQPPPPVQNGQFPGYQSPSGHRPGAELGFGGGLKLQKVGYNYGNVALEAGLFPEARPQPAFPGVIGFSNGQSLQAFPWPALQPWEASMKPGYRYAGVGSQPGLYGELEPELGLGPFGVPEVKTGTSGHLENAYEG